MNQQQVKDLAQTLTDHIVNHPQLFEAASAYAIERLAAVGIHYTGTSKPGDTSEDVEVLYYGLLTEFQFAILSRAMTNLSNPYTV